jgi:hypothetical protein
VTRRLLAAMLGLAVFGTGPSPCVAAALARGPAAAGGAHAAHHGGHDATGAVAHCHEPEATVSARCECGCTSEQPHGAALSFAPAWAVVDEGRGALAPAARAVAPPPAALRAGAPPRRIDHVPIAS